jgi:hypothetical protein
VYFYVERGLVSHVSAIECPLTFRIVFVSLPYSLGSQRVNVDTSLLPSHGLLNKGMEAWSVAGYPGFVFYRKALSVEQEADWLATCTLDYVPDKDITHTNLVRIIN